MKFIYLKSKDIDEHLVHTVADYFSILPGKSVEIHACKDSRELANIDLKKNPAEVVVTFNLAGFDICTLTDGLSYNLENSKFVHFLLEEHLPNERYLSKQLSISMFFYCVGKGYCEYLWRAYPEIPYLKYMEGWDFSKNLDDARANNVSCIVEAIEEVIRECRL